MTRSDSGDTPQETPTQPAASPAAPALRVAESLPAPGEATRPASPSSPDASVTPQTAAPDPQRDALFQRLQVLLGDSRRILQRMSHAFPSSGLDAQGQGERLAALLDRLLLWEKLARGELQLDDAPTPSSALDEATWARIEQHWPTAQARLGTLAPKQYPAQLRAFCQRHDALRTPSSGHFGDNDLELETLWKPANQLQGTLEHMLWEWQKSHPQSTPRKEGWRRWVFWVVLAVVGGSYLFHGLNRPKRPPTGPPKGALAGGIQGAYFQGTQFQKLERRRVDKSIWFHWQASPITGVNPNYFSIRWAGYLQAPKSGRYKLCLRHDDGASLRIGGHMRVNKWRRGKDSVHCTTTSLDRGWHRLVVHLFDRYGPAIAQLSWQPPGAKNPKKIPAQRLCCHNL